MQEATELSGWAVTILFCVTVVLPFWYRWRSPDDEGFLLRMRTHFSIGFGIAALSLLHAAVGVSSLTGGSHLIGLAVATLGLFAAFGQVGLGLQLRRHRRAGYRGRLVAAHVSTMVALAALGATHLLLDGPLTRCVVHLATCTT